ncbi:MAG: hypothetical protein FWF56_05510 [Firmicutes bacterium]|nr:hypothetical protein [Bacillota bacterium]MCL1953661.1 hypothetical protein [Bacillota bacterium]
MSDGLRRFTAWVALFFMTVFTVVFIIVLAMPDILQGRLVWLAVFCFVVGLLLFVLIKMDNNNRAREQMHDSQDDNLD